MHRFSATDLYLHRLLSDVDASAAHDTVVFVRKRARRKRDTYETTLWKLSSGGSAAPQQLTSRLFDARSPALSPDGTRVAFLSKRGKDAKARTQVHLLDLAGGEARPLTRSKRTLKSIDGWSGDGKRLLATAEVPWAEDEDDDASLPDGERPIVIDHLPYKLDGSGTVAGHHTLLLCIDAQSGAETVLADGDFDVKEAQWSPDGRRLAFVRTRGGRTRHRTDLWLADAKGGDARQITDDLASVMGLRWAPDSRSIAFGAGRIEGDSYTELGVLAVARGEVDYPAGHDLQLEGATIAWHPDGRRLATIASHRGLQQITVVDVEARTSFLVDGGLRHVSALAASRDRLVFVAASMRRLDEIHARDWEGNGERRHTAFNRKWFRARARPRVSKREFDVPDGNGGTERVEAWVLLPGKAGDGPFPILVDMHGGPQSVALIDFASHLYWYELLSAGWMIVAPNTVGSGSYGREFARRLRGRWGQLDLPQHLAIIKTLQRERLADHRLACTGKSYGGFLSAWAIGNSDVFKAAVVSAPIGNVESHTGTSDSGYYVTPYAMDGEMSEARERYQALSPVEYCAAIRAATLFLQGQDDQRCPLGQSEELFSAIVRCSKVPVRMVVYPGGSHSMAASGKPSHREDYHHRLAAWVQRHV